MTRRSPVLPDSPLTIEEYLRLPDDDGYRDELVRGYVVREPIPAPEHARVSVRLTAALHAFVEREDLGVVLAEGGFLLAEDPPTIRGPDVSFVSAERIPPEGFGGGFWNMAPDLAIEVISPSNTAAAIQEKVLDYLHAGASLVWVIHPRTRTAVVHRTTDDVRVLRESDALESDFVLPGFRLELADLFGRR